MYCLHCYYDLRGQREARCPECGAAFDFHDPRTFLVKRPTLPGRGGLWLHRHRRVFAATLTILLFVSYAVSAYKLPPLRPWVHPSVISGTNLKVILVTWMIQRNDRSAQTEFDRLAAQREMRPGYSAWSEYDRARAKHTTTYVLTWAPIFLIPTIVYLALLMPILHRDTRRAGCLAIAALGLVLVASASPSRWAAFLWPGSHAFLDDYEFVASADITSSNPQRGTTIAAYDVRSFVGERRRIVGFADGHVELLWDERARPLFEAQGVPYPAPAVQGR